MARKAGKSPAPPTTRPAPGPAMPIEPTSLQPQTTITKKPSKSKLKKKSYASEGVRDNDIFLLPGSDYQILGLITIIGALVRLFRIYQPTSVVFDEVHFGGFASKYIKGKFFMDVHPPLAKLLITLAGWLAGFDGDFDFKDIGKDYLEPQVPYVAMRMLPAVLGIATIPFMFLSLKALGCRTFTAAMGAALLIFENGLLTQSRLILLDSPLVVCTAFTALAFICFSNQHELGPDRAFDASWWFWLTATGLGLGATVSVKWVGLFTIAWVGVITLLQLWVLLADTQNVTPRKWLKHFFARAFCLIVLPVFFYVGMFGIHFLCLVNPGDGDGFMSSEFQATLNNKAMADTPADVIFGSEISLRHWNTQGGYLHSHAHMYPTGSKQQQITLYPHKDENNVWLLENQTQPVIGENQTIAGPRAWANMTEYIKDGDVLRLYHTTTHRRLHSHDQRPPVTEADWQQEVTAYGYEGFEGDANDFFRVEIIKHMSDGALAKERLRTIQTKFKLVHIMSGCVLFSHKVKLPDWGFEQQEVTCAKGGTLPNSVWYVEQNYHPLLEGDVEKVNYRNPGFFGKFWELQKVMWKTNAGLVESHAWDSRPTSWPILRRGINFWGKDHRQIYLLGNPVIWWSSTLAILAYVAFKALAVIRWQRSCNDYSNVTFKRFDYEIGQTVLGWALHYFPFFLMARQLFLHHYFPALYFAIMALCQIYDFGFHRVSGLGLRENPMIGRSLAVLFVAFSIGVFTLYAPLAYGNRWTQNECKMVKLFDTWDFDCSTFLNDYSEYANIVPEGDAKPTVPSLQIPSNKGAEEAVTPQAQPAAGIPPPDAEHPNQQKVLGREERVEYRDQDGNLLDDAQVSALLAEGKASFSTKYETETKVVDEHGNIIPESAVAPEHPDAEGANPDTKGNVKPGTEVPRAEVSLDDSREEQLRMAKPASDASEATK
ncbi:Dolichyl-phosphate-mannose--protein mannosyltransferase 1 [Lithohypha guttulata]|uniref:Dolichyl-phosphate-mannose--protein mannosyltransferase n=1 Tax=Lithohypha guttulata TaxID=1690604 RepID=A0AAN7SYI3_9EURO|nr:Dolichyl-phosphate-mannose--protein mannosyltransferase 1 [Lithohypha guttulata]KAK5084800.1 Dolichyl-phosphate-mannose--protein mannosyltransferase 1 [Lithohypha guttulata]